MKYHLVMKYHLDDEKTPSPLSLSSSDSISSKKSTPSQQASSEISEAEIDLTGLPLFRF